MSKRILLFFVVVFALLNGGVMAWSYTNARAWLGNEEHRLPSIRVIDGSCQAPFIRKFIALQDWSRPTFLVLGDSQPFNDASPMKRTWHYALAQKMNLHPVNMAVIDGRPVDTAYIAGLLDQAGVRVKMATMNINHAHINLPGKGVLSIDTRAAPFEFTRCAIRLRRQMLAGRLVLPGHRVIPRKYLRVPLQPNRYDINLRLAGPVLKAPLEAIKRIAERPVGYVTPNNVEAFGSYGFDLRKYALDSRALRNICLLTLDECVDASRSLGAANFWDIVHFNDVGNRYFPGVLERGLKTPALSASVPGQ
jgi:hypothetical protein